MAHRNGRNPLLNKRLWGIPLGCRHSGAHLGKALDYDAPMMAAFLVRLRAAVSCLPLLGAACAIGEEVHDEAAPPPNVLVILTDDQRWDSMSVTGNALVDTPNLDRLAHDGVRFANAFVTTPICAASRATLFTGDYECAHGFTFATPPLAEPWVAASYPVRLRQAGYRTGFVGKFGVKVPQGGEQRMFDSYAPLNPPYFKKQKDGTQRHLTDLSIDRAIEFLDGCKQDQPWCLSISFNAPHAVDGDPQQYFWPAAQDAVYAETRWPVPATMTDEFFAGLPEFLRTSESRVRFGWRFDEPSKYQRMVTGYHRMIRGVDAAVGRLRDELQRRGLADNTVIVFLSDNGYFLGERGLAGKWYGYEESLRVPLVVVDPRQKARAGRVVEVPALNVDVAPTVLDYAGLPAVMQGRSLRPLVRGEVPADWRTDFLFEHRFKHARIPESEGVRDARFTYIRWYEQKPVVEELYDRDADPAQLHNVVGDPAHAATLARLRARTDELRDGYSAVPPEVSDR
ncbi:MAG: hypothetical protein RL398_216 [Planctomycetota bacterium]